MVRVPCTLISDNGLQFDSKSFKRYYYDLGITNRYSTPAYPHGNGQVEAVNKIIVNGLKKRLDDAKEKWVEGLSHVLQTYRTTTCRLTGETPFSMTYGAEVVILLEPKQLFFQRLASQYLEQVLSIRVITIDCQKRALILLTKEEKMQWSNQHITNTSSSKVMMSM